MKAYVLLTETIYYHWKCTPDDLEKPNKSGLCWVEGDNETDLLRAAKTKFANYFSIQTATIQKEVSDFDDVLVVLDVKPLNTTHSDDLDIAIDGTYVLRREVMNTGDYVLH